MFCRKFSQLIPLSKYHLFPEFIILAKIGKFLYLCKSYGIYSSNENEIYQWKPVSINRPHMLKHTQVYSALVDRYMERHKVRTGITGWAQVNGYHGETSELWKMEQRTQV